MPNTPETIKNPLWDELRPYLHPAVFGEGQEVDWFGIRPVLPMGYLQPPPPTETT